MKRLFIQIARIGACDDNTETNTGIVENTDETFDDVSTDIVRARENGKLIFKYKNLEKVLDYTVKKFLLSNFKILASKLNSPLALIS